MSGSSARVGVIGVGEMGRPVVDRLLATGHRVAAYVRRPEIQAELAASGVETAASIAALAAGRDVVILFVFTDEQVRQVTLEDGLVDAMDPGSLLIIMTTSSPQTAQAIAVRANPRGVVVVDSPVSGGPDKIAAGTITLLVGGADEDVERARATLQAFADPILHMGPLGAGQAAKLINNLMFGAHIQLAVEACRLGRAFGLDAASLANAIGNHGSGGSQALKFMAVTGSPEAMVKGGARFIYKDVTVARASAADAGADLGLLKTITDPLLAAMKP